MLVNGQNVATTPNWRNGWSVTYLYYQNTNLYYQGLNLVQRVLRRTGWFYTHLNKAALTSFLKAKNIEWKSEEQGKFRDAVASCLQNYAMVKIDLNLEEGCHLFYISPKDFSFEEGVPFSMGFSEMDTPEKWDPIDNALG